ncbi:uncharacterized protein LOC134766048 [Penaeus indicus]|uniref:uncharacterized protein LOC134766048 n=1 Tax=Penaeus indicus TaxID=29960 RepID=UPI00300CC884
MDSQREPERSAPEDPLRQDPKRPKVLHDDAPKEAPPAAKDWEASMRLPHPDITRPTKRQNLVVKFCVDIEAFNSAVGEAKVMQTLRAVPGLQRLRISIALQVAKIFRAIHSHGLVHNDIKGDNLCVRMTPGGPEVTTIDFGITFKGGSLLSWAEDTSKHYAPEMRGRACGESTSLTDVYSIGFFLATLFSDLSPKEALAQWLARSSSADLADRLGLDSLVDALQKEGQRLQR